MKISAIKTTIQKPARKILPYAIGAMALVGCQHPIEKINCYCRHTDKTINQYKECVERNERIHGYQAILDSLVFRDLLNNSELANDSSAIAEFNKISTTCRYRSALERGINDTDKFLEGYEISTKDYQYIMNRRFSENRQFYADKYLFKKFFTEKGLMTKSFEEKFERLSDFLRPISTWRAAEVAYLVEPNNEQQEQ